MRHQCGIYYNRGRFVVSIMMIPLIVIFACSEKILIGIGQDPGVAKKAHTYCTVLIPGVWAMALFDATRKFLSA
jgi:MATE family multidrug resistance protein